MGLKTKIGMAMATSAAGAAMVVGGSFALFSDYKYTNSDNFTTGTLVVNADAGMSRVDAGSADVGNMAPGDTASESFNISNGGTLTEWVSLETTPQAGTTAHSIWEDFAQSKDSDAGTLGTYHGLDAQSASGQGGSGIYDTNPGGDFASDNHHATFGYTVVVHHGGNNSTPVTVTNLSGDQWNYNHPFLLAAGDTATVTYSVTLPLAAHNDYQGLDGKLNVEVDAVQARNNWHVNGQGRQDGEPDFTQANSGAIIPFSWQPDTGL